MKRKDVEHLVRELSWPEPPASLRARVLSDLPVAEQPIAGAARVAGSQDPARRTRIAHDNARVGHGWRRATVMVGVGILIMLGSCTGFDVWANRGVEAEITRIEARFGSLDEKAQQMPAVPAADNRARMVRAAAALAIPMPGWEFHYVPHPLPSPVPTELRTFAESNRAAIGLAGEIRTRHHSAWEISRNSSNWPPLDAIRILSDAIYVTTLMDLEAGRPDDAANLMVSGLGISTTIRQDPQLILFDGIAWRGVEQLDRLVTLIDALEGGPQRTCLVAE